MTHMNLQQVSLDKLDANKITLLSIGGRYSDNTPIDLTGIEKMTNVKQLCLWSDAINTDKIGELQNIEVLKLSSDISDLSFISKLKNLKVIEFDDVTDKPDDFFECIYGCENIRFLLVSCWEKSINEEQYKAVQENMPWLDICSYKIG